jgi:hypothetical protein
MGLSPFEDLLKINGCRGMSRINHFIASRVLLFALVAAVCLSSGSEAAEPPAAKPAAGVPKAPPRRPGRVLPPGPIASGQGPAPGIGLLVQGDEMPALREKLKKAPWSEMYARVAFAADVALNDWPKQREQIAPHLSKVYDLSVQKSGPWPKEPEAREAAAALQGYALQAMCPAAFVYLVSGEPKVTVKESPVFTGRCQGRGAFRGKPTISLRCLGMGTRLGQPVLDRVREDFVATADRLETHRR